MVASTQIFPSIAQGYARSQSESDSPQLWPSLAAYDFGGLSGKGETAFDISRHRRNGTLTGMEPQTDYVLSGNPQAPGRALDFDGTNDFVDTNFIPVTGSNPRTVAMWVRPNVLPDEDPSFIAWGSTSTGQKWSFRLATDDSNLRIEIAGSGYNSSLVLIASVWQFIGITLNGTTLGDHILYLETASENASGGATVNTGSNTDASIGWSAVDSSDPDIRYFDGLIDKVYLYDRALSANEMGLLHADPFAPFRLRPRIRGIVPAAPGGLSIPVAMASYRRRRAMHNVS